MTNALARPPIEAQTIEDMSGLVGIMRRFVARAFELIDATSPFASRALNAEVSAGRVRILVEHDLSYPGKMTLIAESASGGREALACMTLDRADHNFLRVVIAGSDSGAIPDRVLN